MSPRLHAAVPRPKSWLRGRCHVTGQCRRRRAAVGTRAVSQLDHTGAVEVMPGSDNVAALSAL